MFYLTNYYILKLKYIIMTCEQITVKLFNHQLLSIQDMEERENKRKIIYNHDIVNNAYNLPFRNNGRYTINTNFSILGNDPGSGKTLISLALIARDKMSYDKQKEVYNPETDEYEMKNLFSRDQLNEYYTKKYKKYVYTDSSLNIKLETKIRYLNCNLIVVPQGGVFRQWKQTIQKQTTLRAKFIETRKEMYELLNPEISPDIPENAKRLYDLLEKDNTQVLLVSSSFYCKFCDDYSIVSEKIYWHRVIIDEADSIRCPDMRSVRYRFAWFITATWESLRVPRNNGLIKNIFKNYAIALMEKFVIERNEEYYTELFRDVNKTEKIYNCIAPISYISRISNFISGSVLEMINANNFSGAIRELGGRSGTGEEIIDVLTTNIRRKLDREAYQRQYYANNSFINEREKTERLKNIDANIKRLKSQLVSISERVTNLDDKECGICCCEYTDPVCLSCTHVFCSNCVLQWIQVRNRSYHRGNAPCPLCKTPIDLRRMTKITIKEETKEEEKEDIEQPMGKDETILKIIRNNPNGKFIIFSNHYESFASFERLLESDRQIKKRCKRLKGNANTVSKTLRDFEKGKVDVILLNSQHNGAGIDLPTATDVILYHKLREDLEKQVIGRALRIGRPKELPLNIHKLYYENERNILT